MTTADTDRTTTLPLSEATVFTPCPCPEAELLRQILSGEVPAADTPVWRALAAAIESRAAQVACQRLTESRHAIAAHTAAERDARQWTRRDGYDRGPDCGRYFCPGTRWCVTCALDTTPDAPAAAPAAGRAPRHVTRKDAA
ncbi:MAG TPA: hypothetical protein VGD67_28385 [Pseudonocardiaceae bacterium]